MTYKERVNSVLNLSFDIKLQELIQIKLKAHLKENPKDEVFICFLIENKRKIKNLQKKKKKLLKFKKKI